MIFVDLNIPMYLIGAEHPNKRDAQTVLESLVSERKRLVTSAEVFQEILHRYTAIQKRDAIQPAFDLLYGFIDEIFDVTEKDVLRSKDLVLAYQELSARDALHIAVMQQHRIQTLFSFDARFDLVPGINRIPRP